MKNVLFLTPDLGTGGGGAERQITTVAILLKNEGYNVEFLCYGEGNFFSTVLEEKSIPIHWKVYNSYLNRLFGIRSFIRKGKYDVVISFLSTPNFINNFAAIGGKKWKIITGERSAKTTTFTSKRGKIFAWFQRYADHIVCNSNNAKEMWLENYPNYKTKLETVYNYVNIPEITADYIPKRNGKLHIVVAASYQYLKNPIGLIKAVNLLDSEEKQKLKINWYGRAEVVKGDTRAYDEAKDLILSYQLENTISLNDSSSDILNIMNKADIVGLFSELEGLPNAVCEGMVLSKPIIMSKVSDYTVLVDDSNGFLCDWDQLESISRALSDALKLSKDDLIRIGHNSKVKSSTLFARDVITNSWVNLIEK